MNNTDTFLCFDVESNGLHGQAFAVGAVVVSADGTLVDSFEARCPIEGDVDSWVTENVLPALATLPVTHQNAKSLRQSFWEWYSTHKDTVNYILSENGYPVEARFMIACQEDDLENRYTSHPFPWIDASSLLLQAGIAPLTPREALLADEEPSEQFPKHHPTGDALASVHTALKALRMTGHIP